MREKVLETYKIKSIETEIEVNIVEREKEFVRVYLLDFPEFGEGTEAVLENLKRSIITDSTIQAERMMDPDFVDSLKKKFQAKAEKVLDKELPNIAEGSRNVLIGMLLEEMLGLGKIEFLLNDGNLEEIVINAATEPIWVYHKGYGWLKTNVFISPESEIQNYASIIARRIGKQITILNPLLDAHLITGDRANATLFPISSKGNTITIRRFRREPYTVTDFVENKTVNTEVMALIWLVMEYELNIIFSGGTGSGKTTSLNVCLPFIQPNQRILSIEDSVSGNSEIIYSHEGTTKKTTVGKLIDGIIEDDSIKDISLENNEEIEIQSMNKKGIIEWKKPSNFIRHWVKKDLMEITLKSGRKIKVTPDHSLFTFEEGKIKAIKGNSLNENTLIATPRKQNWSGKKVSFDLRKNMNAFDGCFMKSIEIGALLKENKTLLKNGFGKSAIQNSIMRNTASVKMIKTIQKIPQKGWISSGQGTQIPLEIEIDEEFARFIGIWLADGCYDKNSVLMSIVEPEARKTVECIAERFNLKTKMHSDGFTLMVNSKPVKQLMENVFELKGNAYTKKVPEWVFSLKRKEIAALLNGYFSGDGWVRKNDIAVRSSSMQLLKDMQTLLSRFGIPLRVKWKLLKDKTFEARISGTKFLKKYVEDIGFCINKKNTASEKWLTSVNHDITDIIPITKEMHNEIKKALKEEVGKTRTYKGWKSLKYRGVIGRENLQKIILKYPEKISFSLQELAFNDLQWDRIEKISTEKFEGFVYDFSVPENESFIADNIVCHNTRELSLPPYLHWVPLTTREPNVEGKGEVSMLQLLINSLRMRPDRLIVGEIRRQREAEVLFEAMHTGHSAYTTVHANTAEETIRRLTNPPIDVPKTMLDSVHLNVVMFRNRRLNVRRVLQVAEFITERRGSEEEVKANVLYRWKGAIDSIEKHSESVRLFDELGLHTGFSKQEMTSELKTKKSILDWLVKNKIRPIKEVGKIMANYYMDKNEIIKMVQENKKPKF
ncbi:MAG: ATPase, T2SS/T4P/T4SS family [archaeon]